MNQGDELNCYVIAGSNGSGKSIFAEEFLPYYTYCDNFINADLIAKGISPFTPDKARIKAGRLVFSLINDFIKKKESFAFETTFSGKTYVNIIQQLKLTGYKIHIFYLWIPSVDLALQRIDDRVRQGGHLVPKVDVERRFERSISNFLNVYRQLADSILFFDNSTNIPRLIFEEMDSKIKIHHKTLYYTVIKGFR